MDEPSRHKYRVVVAYLFVITFGIATGFALDKGGIEDNIIDFTFHFLAFIFAMLSVTGMHDPPISWMIIKPVRKWLWKE